MQFPDLFEEPNVHEIFFNPFFLEVKDDLLALFDLLTFLLPRSGSLQMSSGGYTRPITLSDVIEG